jgi:hypothetical protein
MQLRETLFILILILSLFMLSHRAVAVGRGPETCGKTDNVTLSARDDATSLARDGKSCVYHLGIRLIPLAELYQDKAIEESHNKRQQEIN